MVLKGSNSQKNAHAYLYIYLFILSTHHRLYAHIRRTKNFEKEITHFQIVLSANN